MTDFIVCIACLSSEIKMFSLENLQLPDIFEKLTIITLSKEDKIPKTLCYICYSQLQRCCRFINMSQKAGKILTQLLSDGVKITQGTVSALEERTANNFVTTILKSASVSSCFSVDSPSSNNEKETNNPCPNEEEAYLTEAQVTLSFKEEAKDVIDEQITIEEDFVTIKEEPMDEEVKLATKEGSEQVKEDNLVAKEKNTVTKELKAAIQSQIESNYLGAPEAETKSNDDNLLKLRTKYTKKNKDGPKKKHDCDICDMKFKCHAYLVRHSRIHTGEKPYACNSCDKKFTQNGHLIQHMRVHTGEKPYVCHICKNKAFNHRYNYKTHMKKHFGLPSHICNMCNSAFHQKGDLKRHMMSHTGERPYKCNTCELKFTQNCHLTKHMQLHTREKPHTCTYCRLAFAQKTELKNHIKIHTGNLFPCPLKGCTKSFDRKGTLTNHFRSHKVERPFACDKCDKTFKQKGHLAKHIIIMHDNIKHDKQHSKTDLLLTQGDLERYQGELQLNPVDLKGILKNKVELLQKQVHLHEHVLEEYIIP